MRARNDLVVSWMGPVPAPERDAAPPRWPRLIFFALFWLAAQALQNGALP
jgi:hypothetical protein